MPIENKMKSPSVIWSISALFVGVPLLMTMLWLAATFNSHAPHDAGAEEADRAYWVVDEKGNVVSSNNADAVPVRHESLANTPNGGLAFRKGNWLSHDHVLVVPMGIDRRQFIVSRKHWSPRQIIFYVLTPIFLFIVLSVAIGMFFSKRLLRREALFANKILNEIRLGNLGARFPASSAAKFGPLIERFNDMAVEIERLVKRLNESEALRAFMLQELAHDVRTPLSSIGLIVERLSARSAKIDPKILKQKLKLVEDELSFLQLLLDGLLALAQMEDPNFVRALNRVVLEDLLTKEIGVVRDTESKNEIKWILSGEWGMKASLMGDGGVLARVFRNLLDNALTHAKSLVEIDIRHTKDRMIITVRNDGVEFNEDGLRNYGIRRNVRLIKVEYRKRGSVGLGSVIVKTAVQKLGGSVEAKNWQSGKRRGAEVSIALPLAHAESSSAKLVA